MKPRELLRVISINDVYECTRLPRLATLVREMKKSTEHTTLTTINGDFVSPSVLSGMDKGRGMVDVLNTVPISHCCFGNHEADIGLKELSRRIDEFRGVWLNSNMPTFKHPKLKPYDVVTTPGGWRVGLLGFLLSDPNVFRDGTFKGHKVRDVTDAAREAIERLRADERVDFVLPLTHQSMAADIELARADLGIPVIHPLRAQRWLTGARVVGGHDHDVYVDKEAGSVIVKSGADALHAAVVDIVLEQQAHKQPVSVAVNVDMKTMDDYPLDPATQKVADSHMEVITLLQQEIVVQVHPEQQEFLPLESNSTRKRQTSVGALICASCRDELRTDCCVINGATIKGNRVYDPPHLNFLQLKDELPFPTKMVTVHMTGEVLSEAVKYSRHDGKPDDEKRGYLQCCDRITVDEHDNVTMIGCNPLNKSKVYTVAMPRNLLSGFCEIKPLVEYAKVHARAMPDEDSYVPAFNLVISNHAGEIWLRLGDFENIDSNQDGIIQRHELIDALEKKLGRKPSETMVNNMVAALDTNKDGEISIKEYREFIERRRTMTHAEKMEECLSGADGRAARLS